MSTPAFCKLPPVNSGARQQHRSLPPLRQSRSIDHSPGRTTQSIPTPPEGSPPSSARRNPAVRPWRMPVAPEGSPPTSARMSPPGVRRRASHAQWRHADCSFTSTNSPAPACSKSSSLQQRISSLDKFLDRLPTDELLGSGKFLPSSTLDSEASTCASLESEAGTLSGFSRSNSFSQSSSLPYLSEASCLEDSIRSVAKGIAEMPSCQDKEPVSKPPLLPKMPDGMPMRRETGLSSLLLRRLHGASTKGALTVQTRMEEKTIRQLGQEKIFDLYEWEHVIQEAGDGGKVVVCREKSANDADGEEASKEFVLKMCKKQVLKTLNLEEQYRKVQHRMLNFPSHPGVMALHEVFEDDNYYYSVMDRAEQGPIFQSLVSKFSDGIIPAAVVKQLMRQILEALGHVHRQGMLHRDIKPDNIVVRNGVPTLIDFDHADPDWNPSKPTGHERYFGTIRFSAPETFLGYFSQQSDLYSVGVLLYLLMTGKLPRNDSVLNVGEEVGGRRWSTTMYENLKKDGGLDWECDPWPTNPSCMDFCRTLLSFSPQGRPSSAEEALTHEWLKEERTP